MLATDAFNPSWIRDDLTGTRGVCEKHGCPLEFILKDISTVRYDRARLFEWGSIAMDAWPAGERAAFGAAAGRLGTVQKNCSTCDPSPSVGRMS